MTAVVGGTPTTAGNLVVEHSRKVIFNIFTYATNEISPICVKIKPALIVVQ
jgi:hypothetical protein